MKNVIVVSSSPKRGGNSDILAQKFAEGAMDGAVRAMQGWVDCFKGVKIAGVLRAVGVTNRGEVSAIKFPQTAYGMGEKV